MISVKDKKDCCGCAACVQRCPRHCILMKEDEEGFLYPLVDVSLCIDCGLCEQVCPVIHQGTAREPLTVFAAKNPDEQIRMSSSSGGIFTLLAEQVLAEGGVVFGARFDEHWEVVHAYTETVEGLAAFRGSKYVQSRTGDSFVQAERFLRQGRKVLFSGTPCQISGLRCFLRKEYDNLVTVDFICHGVPSPGVWRAYLKEKTARQCGGKNSVLSHSTYPLGDVRVENIAFRDKRYGWKKFSFALTLSAPGRRGAKNTVLLRETKYKNVFLKGFLRDLYLRPSCHECPAKCFKSGSDVTIGDFWSINDYLPRENDHCGYSLCLVHSDIKWPFKSIRLDDETVYKTNVSIYRSSRAHKNRKLFFKDYARGRNVIPLIGRYATVTLKKRVRLWLADLLNN